ncbi:hypothetical protein M8C21_032507 [Ambrosia artemisiifolia]|uniref:Uncharacterized protein n=1 Tax=Ambrosia artemisiifolia TaxID=4212 RepID=A0AAD5GT49_AMBAR|nr:hypothetical protein M8C21_032507 [Ambrosia artemisiifolia]
MVIGTRSGKRQHVELSAAGALVCLPYDVRATPIDVGSSTPVFKAIKKRKRNFEINSDSDGDNFGDSDVAGSKLKSRPTQSWAIPLPDHLLTLLVFDYVCTLYNAIVLCNCVKTMVIGTPSGKRQHLELSAVGALVCLPYDVRVFKAIKKRKRNFEINSDSDGDNVGDSEVAGSKLKSRPTQSWLIYVDTFSVNGMSTKPAEYKKSLSFADEDAAETSKTLDTPTKRIMDVVTELGELYGVRAVSNVSVDVEGVNGHVESADVDSHEIRLGRDGSGEEDDSSDSGGENEWLLTRVGPVGKCYGGQPENEQSVPLTGIRSNLSAGVSKQSDPVPVDDAPNTKASKNVAMNTESASSFSLGLTQLGDNSPVEGKKHNEAVAEDLVVNVAKDVAGEKLSGDQMLRIMVRGALLATKILTPQA